MLAPLPLGVNLATSCSTGIVQTAAVWAAEAVLTPTAAVSAVDVSSTPSGELGRCSSCPSSSWPSALAGTRLQIPLAFRALAVALQGRLLAEHAAGPALLGLGTVLHATRLGAAAGELVCCCCSCLCCWCCSSTAPLLQRGRLPGSMWKPAPLVTWPRLEGLQQHHSQQPAQYSSRTLGAQHATRSTFGCPASSSH